MCAKSNQSNCFQQYDLHLEIKSKSIEWLHQVSMSLFGVVVVDKWYDLDYYMKSDYDQKDFYGFLSNDLIYNRHDNLQFTCRETLMIYLLVTL